MNHFDEDSAFLKWKGVLLTSLRKVLEQVHPSLTARDDALLYVEDMCLRLLATLCAKPLHTIQDVEEKITRTFPTPIDRWALAEAREIIDKSKKKKSVLPVDRVHTMLQKEVLQYKIDSSVSLFLVAVLEYISADILILVGNYVKNIKHLEITREDIEVAMCADKALMDMFCQGDPHLAVSPLPPITPRDSLSYEEVVKELIHDEKQYQRELHMIIRVFREELSKIVDDPKELDPIFSNIIDIYEVTVTLLGSLEDVIEMSQEQSTPVVGSCFEELAEAEEFDVYVKYANDVTSQQAKDALSNLLAKPKALSLLTAGHCFREAVKFYLPKLLLSPIGHAFLYIEYVDKLLQLSTTQEDRESLEQVKGLLEPLKFELQKQIPLLPKESLIRMNSRVRRQQAIEKTRELQNTVEHWEKDIGQSCNEFIREDTLAKLSSGKRITERKVYLFDGLLVLCKRRQTVTAANFDFRMKERFFMRKVDIIDRPDTDEMKNAFEISPREPHAVVLIAKNAQHKNDWMADLVMLNTKPMLERILDSILLDIEKRHPLKLPSPELYKFAVPDSSSNIVLEERECAGVPLIKGATLCKLIERLTYHIYADPMFVRTFLTTFRSFCSSQELLQLLIERYEIPEPSLVYDSNSDKDVSIETEKYHKASQREDWKRYKKEFMQPVQFRVLNVFRHWVDQHYYDFTRDPTLKQKLMRFLETVKGKSMRKWVNSVLNIMQRKIESDENHRQITFAYGHSPPAIEYHLQVPENEFNLLTLHPLELARQLTLLEFELYKNVKPAELVGTVWTKKDKETKSPNLLKIMKHTTNFTRWIEKSIIESENFEERVAIVTRAIEVMTVLYELNNFNGVLSIVSAMGTAAVFRLKCTFQAIPKRYEAFLLECRDLNEDHFRKYQEKLRSINPPCVPFFGMYLTNILYIEEGNPDFLTNTELINFSKRRKVAEITGEIQQYQNQPYCLKVDPKIRHFLESLDPFKGMSVTEVQNYLWSESLRIEPRHAKTPGKFPRKWPELTLKSPGIKPKRHNNSNSGTLNLAGPLSFSQKNVHLNTSEGEQSPPPANVSSSAHDFSVFASVNIQSGGGGGYNSYPSSIGHNSDSHATLTSLSSLSSQYQTQSTDFSDMISINSTVMTPAPEIPRRSNSIISMTSHNNIDVNKPLLSPRVITPGHSRSSNEFQSTSGIKHAQHAISPKILDSLNEETGSMAIDRLHDDSVPPPISERLAKHDIQHLPHKTGTHFRNASGISSSDVERSIYPSSPKLHNSGNYDHHHHHHHHHHSSPHQAQASSNEFGPLPISPHVNVPNAHNFTHVAPPPLPPRVRRKNTQEFSHSQIRQAPDAPLLPARDQSPPPLPPRTHLNSNLSNISDNWNHISASGNNSQFPQFNLSPHTSTIMMRRNSAMEQRKDSPQTPMTPLSAASVSSPANNELKLSHNSPISIPPRKISSNTSPKPGIDLPPKPSQFSAKSDRASMFQYPSTN